MAQPRFITAAEVQQIQNADVTGPSSSTDGNVTVFDGTTGKAIKESTALTFNKTNQKLTVKSQANSADNSIEVVDKDGVTRVGMLGSDFHGNADVAVYGGDGTFGAEMVASFNDAQIFVFDNTNGAAGAISLSGSGRLFSNLNADGLSSINIQRFTDTTPTGYFISCNNAGGNPVFAVDINGLLCLTPIATPPASATEGMIYADTDHHLYYYNGTTWKQLDN
jgi:hypothetical protein